MCSKSSFGDEVQLSRNLVNAVVSFWLLRLHNSVSECVCYPVLLHTCIDFRIEIVDWLCFSSVLVHRICGLTESSSPRLPLK